MEPIISADGIPVTEEMLDSWCNALDRDEWPEGERNLGPIMNGGPQPLSPEETAVLSVKLPISMKRALIREAGKEKISTSELVRLMLTQAILALN